MSNLCQKLLNNQYTKNVVDRIIENIKNEWKWSNKKIQELSDRLKRIWNRFDIRTAFQTRHLGKNSLAQNHPLSGSTDERGYFFFLIFVCCSFLAWLMKLFFEEQNT